MASGLLGDSAFAGGVATALLGLGLHFCIALTMSVTFYLLARRWPELWQKPLLWGGVYGLILYGVMNYLVVPLSAARPSQKTFVWVGLSIGVHVLLIGIPMALCARRALVQERSAT